MSNIDSIWKKEGEEWKKMAVNSSVPGVGYIWQDIKFNGVSYNTWTGGNAGFPLMYYDMDNEVRYAAVYISGSDKLWFGVNFAANRRGWALGELVVPKNSYLTPDRTIKRFKRVS